MAPAAAMTTAVTPATPITHPNAKARLFAPDFFDSSIKTMTIIGTGLTATPIAKVMLSPIACPMESDSLYRIIRDRDGAPVSILRCHVNGRNRLQWPSARETLAMCRRRTTGFEAAEAELEGNGVCRTQSRLSMEAKLEAMMNYAAGVRNNPSSGTGSGLGTPYLRR
jgi:hypothetical protein